MNATHPYAQFLGDRDPLEVLAETHQRIPAIARSLGREGLKRTYAPGKWTAAHVLAHLADCEMAFGFRVRQIISEPNLGIQTFDQDRWARWYASMDGLEAAGTFQALRAWNLSLFRLLDKDDLAKAAAHPERGPEKAETAIRVLAGHTLSHLAQLEKILSTGTA
ncbi:MAG: DinB family protein [Terriglobia bacterium]